MSSLKEEPGSSPSLGAKGWSDKAADLEPPGTGVAFVTPRRRRAGACRLTEDEAGRKAWRLAATRGRRPWPTGANPPGTATGSLRLEDSPSVLPLETKRGRRSRGALVKQAVLR